MDSIVRRVDDLASLVRASRMRIPTKSSTRSGRSRPGLSGDREGGLDMDRGVVGGGGGHEVSEGGVADDIVPLCSTRSWEARMVPRRAYRSSRMSSRSCGGSGPTRRRGSSRRGRGATSWPAAAHELRVGTVGARQSELVKETGDAEVSGRDAELAGLVAEGAGQVGVVLRMFVSNERRAIIGGAPILDRGSGRGRGRERLGLIDLGEVFSRHPDLWATEHGSDSGPFPPWPASRPRRRAPGLWDVP